MRVWVEVVALHCWTCWILREEFGRARDALAMASSMLCRRGYSSGSSWNHASVLPSFKDVVVIEDVFWLPKI
jgi:hypothetical protein